MRHRTHLLLLFWLVCACALQAQDAATSNAPPAADWQKAVGGSMAFDVVSVHEDTTPFTPPSFALSADAWFRKPNGRFHADFALPTYITFAWKLWLTPGESNAMLAGLPDYRFAPSVEGQRENDCAGRTPRCCGCRQAPRC